MLALCIVDPHGTWPVRALVSGFRPFDVAIPEHNCPNSTFRPTRKTTGDWFEITRTSSNCSHRRRGLSARSTRSSIMFNVRPRSYVPGFRVRPSEDLPGFRVGSNAESRDDRFSDGPPTSIDYHRPTNPSPVDFLTGIVPAHYGAREEDTTSAAGIGTPALVPGPGGDGSGSGWDRCTLMPGFQQFGMCLYRCPDGTMRRLDRSPLGCQPFIFRNGGLGI